MDQVVEYSGISKQGNLSLEEIQEIIDELEIPIKQILADLKGNIDQRKYGLLVADDRGGRIPAVILRNVINRYYQDRGQPKIALVFAKLKSKEAPDFDIKKELAVLKTVVGPIDLSKKALVITEFIYSGGVMDSFRKMFAATGIDYDIAALSIGYPNEFDAKADNTQVFYSCGSFIYFGVDSEDYLKSNNSISNSGG